MENFNSCHLWKRVKERLGWRAEVLEWPEENLRDVLAVEEAKREWQIALRYFDEVTEPALIDFAIYNVEAAEKRLVHLMGMLGKKYPKGIWPADFWLTLKKEEANELKKASSVEGS